jgi:hypothetical protein
VITLLVGGALLAPYTLPLLPVTILPTYLGALPVKEVRPETRRMGNVPQIFADELGWESLVAEVAKVYGSLAPEERSYADDLGPRLRRSGRRRLPSGGDTVSRPR